MARTKELSQSVGELRALGEVSQAVNSTLDLQSVLDTIVTRATQLKILAAQPRRTNPDGTPRDHIFGIGPDRGYSGWSKNKAELDVRITKARHGDVIKETVSAAYGEISSASSDEIR